MISKWLNIDLHLHSYKSNEIKPNDFKFREVEYKGMKVKPDNLENYKKVLYEKLKEDEINIFSIVDHNIINFELYDEFEKNKESMLQENLNFLCGMEIDIKDKVISNEFHMIVIFNEYDKLKLELLIKELHSKKTKIDENTKWELNELFDSMYTSGIEEFLLIPHFNNKHKSISVNELMGVKRPLTIFSAFEDGNNYTKLKESISVYLNSEIVDFPTVAFSDWHNKEDEQISRTSILGNVKEPFNSLKLSFNDAEMRLSLKQFNDLRCSDEPPLYLKQIKIQDEIIELSPYQNTVIGGFGSGKSLLGALLRGEVELFGKGGKYEEFKEMYDGFQVELSDGTKINNVYRHMETEGDRIELLELHQSNELYTCKTIDENIQETLQNNVKIEFNEVENKLLNEFNEYYNDNKIKEISSLYESLGLEDSIDIQFTKLSANTTYPNINLENKKINDFDDILINIKNLPVIVEKFAGIEIFNQIKYVESDYMKKEVEEISKKVDELENIKENCKEKFEKIDEIINGYKITSNEMSNGKGTQITKINTMKKNVKEFKDTLIKLKKEINKLENFLNEEEINLQLKKTSEKKITENYSALTGFRKLKKEIKLNEFFVKNEYRNGDLVKSFLMVIKNSDTLLNKKSFEDILKNVKSEYVKLFEVKYSIYSKETEEHILKKSPGGRAIMLMDIILEKSIELKQSKLNILFIDQPEDQLDNKNIYEIIVKKIREIKRKNINLQIFFISHNANIAISSDSENVIIAEKLENNNFTYRGGGFENDNHIRNVADILEGGVEALEKRGIKLNIKNYKEKWESNGIKN